MHVIFAAILPTLLLLTGGALLRRRAPLAAQFWQGLSWLSYWIFTPSLFVTSISTTDLSALSPGPLALSLIVPIGTVAALALLLGKLARANGPQLTSITQGSVRINTYVGLIFASALHGQDGIATFALASVVVVPLVNVISVSVLAVHGDTGRRRPRAHLVKELAVNPLIASCLLGLGLNFFSVPVPVAIASTLDILAAPALACGTLIAGAALRFSFRKRDLLDVSIATVLKLMILPVLAIVITATLDIAVVAQTSIVLICAVPTAPSAYILAERMGGDTRLMAAITGAQTLLATITMPLILALTRTWPA